jgi:hypothetical protein
MPQAALLVTCLVDLFYPEVALAVVRLLRRRGVDVTVPDGQTCCGLPLFNSGYHGEAARAARHTLALFEGAERIVVPSGSCAWGGVPAPVRRGPRDDGAGGSGGGEDPRAVAVPGLGARPGRASRRGDRAPRPGDLP